MSKSLQADAAPPRVRLNVRVAAKVAEQLDTLARRERRTQADVVETALLSLMSPDAIDRRDAIVTRRLDRQARQLEALQQELIVGTESLALFIRYFMSVTPALPESQQTAARAKGTERFTAFTENLSRQTSARASACSATFTSTSDQAWRSSAAATRSGLRPRGPPMQPHEAGRERFARMFKTALGPAIGRFLEEEDVVEVMLNPDGALWVERHRTGMEETGLTLDEVDADRIVRLVAHHMKLEVDINRPFIEADLPETGERFTGVLPPLVLRPGFAIRRHGSRLFSLADYVRDGIMTPDQATILSAGILRRLTSWWSVAPDRARPRWSTRCCWWLPRPATGWC